MSYAIKYSSNLYAPFRSAHSASELGPDKKKTYQMDCGNINEALKEASLILKKDRHITYKAWIMYLDILRSKSTFKYPTLV